MAKTINIIHKGQGNQTLDREVGRVFDVYIHGRLTSITVKHADEDGVVIIKRYTNLRGRQVTKREYYAPSTFLNIYKYAIPYE